MPRVAVHDLAIQERDADIVVATHGRSLYRADLEQIQMLPEIQTKEIYAFEVADMVYDKNAGKRYTNFDPVQETSYQLAYYVQTAGQTTISIATPDGAIVKEWTDMSEAGLNYVSYDLTLDAAAKANYEEYLNGLPVKGYREVATISEADNGKLYLRPGKYIVRFTSEKLVPAQRSFEITDPAE
jgi:hypothetical protein